MNNDTSLDLHNNTLNFKTGKFITYNDNFHLYNGSIKSVNSKNVVYSKSTNPETSLDVSNVVFDIELNENFSEIHSSIQTTSKNLTAINLKSNNMAIQVPKQLPVSLLIIQTKIQIVKTQNVNS
jgi:hypothetical protein